jgi:micrococcal nuclease
MHLSKRQRKKLISALVFLAIIGLGMLSEKLGWNVTQQPVIQQVNQTTAAGTYRVLSVEDGDTIVVDMAGKEERVRFIGVDTPEVKDPRKPVQCFGKAASNFTKELIGGNTVRLEADPENTNRDRYNRLLRYVYLQDNTLVNAKIIEEGYGFAYTSFPFTKKDEFKALENQARKQNRGLWGSCELTPNQYGGFTPAPDPNP